jgi:chromate transporter
MRSILLSLLTLFVPLSLVSVGGGQTLVAEIHRQVVANHHWLTEGQFVDAFAISRMAPGPGTLLVTLIGWQVAGVAGALVASFAIFAPTALLVYGLARIWKRYEGARWQTALAAGLRPVAAGMILASGLVLIEALEGGWLAQGIAVASTALLMLTKVNPVVLMAGGAVVFIALHGVLPT